MLLLLFYFSYTNVTMVVGNNIVVPVVLWGKNAPTHCISAIYMTPDMKNIVTACNDAQLCVWDMSPNWEVVFCFMTFLVLKSRDV
jgi:hypothetical protein